jgi:hypothetical protein
MPLDHLWPVERTIDGFLMVAEVLGHADAAVTSRSLSSLIVSPAGAECHVR